MGDGNKNRHGLTISTESFSLSDTVRLLNVLMVRYRLDCTMRKHYPGYTIYIKEKSMSLLRTLVQPHMHSSMLYKLRINTYEKYTTQVNLSKDISSKRQDLVKLTKMDDASFQIKLLNRNLCSALEPRSKGPFLVRCGHQGKSKKVEIRLNFKIDQKKDVLLLLIKNFLGGNIGYRNLLDNYTYNSDSYGSARKIIKYFDSYHLLSHKYLDFLRWRKTYVLLQLENGLTDKDKMRIKNFASKLSINRTNTFLGF
jgi:LAGLIDADG endonuclease/LAGLIDADG DNA endonuclease family